MSPEHPKHLARRDVLVLYANGSLPDSLLSFVEHYRMAQRFQLALLWDTSRLHRLFF